MPEVERVPVGRAAVVDLLLGRDERGFRLAPVACAVRQPAERIQQPAAPGAQIHARVGARGKELGVAELEPREPVADLGLERRAAGEIGRVRAGHERRAQAVEVDEGARGLRRLDGLDGSDGVRGRRGPRVGLEQRAAGERERAPRSDRGGLSHRSEPRKFARVNPHTEGEERSGHDGRPTIAEPRSSRQP